MKSKKKEKNEEEKGRNERRREGRKRDEKQKEREERRGKRKKGKQKKSGLVTLCWSWWKARRKKMKREVRDGNELWRNSDQ